MNRICKKCGEEKDIEQFNKHPSCAGGRRHTCRKCSNEQQNKRNTPEKLKSYYTSHRTRILENQKKCRKNHPMRGLEYRQKNPERARQYDLQYSAKNKDRLQKYRKDYYARNAERILEYQKEYYKKNTETIKSRSTNYYLTHGDRRKELVQLNKEKIKKNQKKHREKYAEHYREKSRRTSVEYADSLSDVYIRARLRRAYGLSQSFMKQNSEFIEIYRVNLKLKRLIKDNANEKCN